MQSSARPMSVCIGDDLVGKYRRLDLPGNKEVDNLAYGISGSNKQFLSFATHPDMLTVVL